MKRIILLSLALVLSGVLLAGCSHIAGDALVTDTPKFSVLEFPLPPSQHKPWTPPATDLPANLVSSVKVLFDLGLADPRGCEYREFETITGWVRGQTNKVTAHGWIMPARSGFKQTLAAGWDGLVHLVVEVGKKADLQQDIQSLLRTDELWRKAAATNQVHFRMWWIEVSQEFHMSQTNMTPIKVALLLRLGEPLVVVPALAACLASRTNAPGPADDSKADGARPNWRGDVVERSSAVHALAGFSDVYYHRSRQSPQVEPDYLAQIRQAMRGAVPALVKTLSDEDWSVAMNAAEALGEAAVEPDLAVPALIKSLDHPQRDVRRSAAVALGDFGQAAQSAVTALTKIVQADPHGYVGFFAETSLAKIGPPAKP